MASTTLDEIKLMIQDLKAEFINQINNRQVSSKQIRTNMLSDISETLGLVKAGEFRSGNGSDPGKGFSGVRMGYPAFVYNDQSWNLVGVNSDALSFGLSAENGAAYAADGLITLNQNGINIDGSGVGFTLNDNWFLGGLMIGNSTYYGLHALAPVSGAFGTPLINESFDASTISTDWTVSGSPELIETASGSHYCIVNSTDYISRTVTTVDGGYYALRVRFKSPTGNTGTSPLLVTATNMLGGTSSSSPVVATGFWTTVEILLYADDVTSLITISGDTAEDVYIDDIYMRKLTYYSVTGSATDAIGTYAITSNTGSSLQVPATATTGQSLLMVTAFGATVKGDKINLVGPMAITESTSTPSVGFSAGAGMNMYMKDDKLVIQFNDAGTTRYKYLDLTGTGVTWVHTTTAP